MKALVTVDGHAVIMELAQEQCVSLSGTHSAFGSVSDQCVAGPKSY
jgi:hypothetical protein